MKSKKVLNSIQTSQVVTVFLLMLLSQALAAQKKVLSFPVTISYQDSAVQLGKMYFDEILEDSIRFDKIKFYISEPQILSDGKVLKSYSKQHRLIDASVPSENSIDIKLRGKNIPDELTFYIGVDSLSNVTGAHADDLDPSNGMYWAWQSGYVFFKLEGYSPKSKNRNHQFVYHIGGFEAPHKAIQNIRLNIEGDTQIVLDLSKIISEFDVLKSDNIMSPSKEAVDLSKYIAKSISVQ